MGNTVVSSPSIVCNLPRMEIDRHRDKLAAAAAFFAANTQYCGLTKLCKLLYFLDFIHFRQTGRTVTGLEYRAWPMGPVPVDFWKEVHEGLKPPLSAALTATKIVDEENPRRFTKIQRTSSSYEQYLTKREKKILSELAEVYREATAEMMIDVTHLKNKPWDKILKQHGHNAVIPPELACDGSTPDQLHPDELAARVAEFAERVAH